MGSGEVIDWYLKKFEPVSDFASVRFSHSDVWFRYHEPEDVRRWANFVLEILPQALAAFAPQIIC